MRRRERQSEEFRMDSLVRRGGFEGGGGAGSS